MAKPYDVETLLLSAFSKPPKLDFSSVKVGQSRVCQLNFSNPHEQPQIVRIEKFPSHKGFSVASMEFTIDAGTMLPVCIEWKPTEPGNCREMIMCQVDSGPRVQAYLLGSCPEPPKPKKTSKVIKSLKQPTNKIGTLQRTSKQISENKENKPRAPLQNSNILQQRSNKQLPHKPTNVSTNEKILTESITNQDKENDPRMTFRLSKPTVLPPGGSSLNQSVVGDNYNETYYLHQNTTQVINACQDVTYDTMDKPTGVNVTYNTTGIHTGSNVTYNMTQPIKCTNVTYDTSQITMLETQIDEYTTETTDIEYYDVIEEYIVTKSPGGRETVSKSKSDISNRNTVHSEETTVKSITTKLVLDEHGFNESPLRRMTFIKNEAQAQEMTPRRTTFQKDDPALPITPMRRETFLKEANNLPNTPVICSPDSLDGSNSPSTPRSRCKMGLSSLNKKRNRSASPPVCRKTSPVVTFKDASMLADPQTSEEDTGLTPLKRHGTYTKLDSSLSPKVPVILHSEDEADESDKDQPAPVVRTKRDPKKLSIISERSEATCTESIEDGEIDEENIEAALAAVYGVKPSPGSSKYATAYTTPYESPGLSDSEDKFEESMSYMPGENRPSEANNTVLENSLLMASLLRDKLEKVTSFDGTPPCYDAQRRSCDSPALNDSIACLLATPIVERKQWDKCTELEPSDFMCNLETEQSKASEQSSRVSLDTQNDSVKYHSKKESMFNGSQRDSFGVKSHGQRDSISKLLSPCTVNSGWNEPTPDSPNPSGNDSIAHLLQTPGICKELKPVPEYEEVKVLAAKNQSPERSDQSRSALLRQYERSPSMYINPFSDDPLEVSTLGFPNESFINRDKMTLGMYRSAKKANPSRRQIAARLGTSSKEESLIKANLRNHLKAGLEERQNKASNSEFLPQTPKSANKRLETVECEIRQRLSSTPKAATPDVPQHTEDDYDDQIDVDTVRTPSPIIGRRVSRDTVTKSKDPVLRLSDLKPPDGPEAKKGLFGHAEVTPDALSSVGSVYDLAAPLTISQLKGESPDQALCEESPNADTIANTKDALEPKRFSTMTVTKTKPEVIEVSKRNQDVPVKKHLFDFIPIESDRKKGTEQMQPLLSKKPPRGTDKPVLVKQRNVSEDAVKAQKAGMVAGKVQPSKTVGGKPTVAQSTGKQDKNLRRSVAVMQGISSSKKDTVKTTEVIKETSPMKREHSVDRKDTTRKRFRSEQLKNPPLKTNKRKSSSIADKLLNSTVNQRQKAALAGMSKSGGSNKAPGLAQSKLTLIRQPKPSGGVVKHPLAFAAKNMYYDERWMEKEERGFVKWLNFILTPTDFYFDARKPQKIDALKLFSDNIDIARAPTKETLSYRAYSQRRRLNNLRRAACKIYQSDLFVGVLSKVERETECGRLAIRTDRAVFADLGLKQKILEMLLSYNPLWLRIGLETVYGEVVYMENVADVLNLSRFVAKRLLGNPDIAREYAHPSVPNYFTEGYYVALGQFTLKKLLLLIMFLDHAKRSRLVDEDPCLFCKDSEYKSSKDLLLAFSRDFLSGEGDLVKHLGYLGYRVGHSQCALEEVDYAVENIATDLRDGLRVTMVVSKLTSDHSLLESLRCPAISRLQKIHNVGVALRALTDRRVDLTGAKGGEIDARDIVDGHREKTLHLLWKIIFNFQVESVVDIVKLRQEIVFVKKSLMIRKQQEALFNDQDPDMLGLPRDSRSSVEPSEVYFCSEKLRLLLRWCRAVCAHFNVQVENFTVSFSDGRALCYLVHYYHPELLPVSQIRDKTTQTYDDPLPEDTQSDTDDSFSYSTLSAFPQMNTELSEELLKNERENFKLLYEKVSELGGVPLMLRATDMLATIPDEKVVVTYVSYLCARLLDLRQEARAARIIQHAWRRHCVLKGQGQLQQRQKAAIIIQRGVRQFLLKVRNVKRQRAAIVIQRCFRGYQARSILQNLREQARLMEKSRAILTLQRSIRGYLVRKHTQRVEKSAVVIQRTWRGYRQRQQFKRLRQAVTVVQRKYRAKCLCLIEREKFVHLRSSALTIQSAVRRWLLQRQLKLQWSAILIQNTWRGYKVREDYLNQRSAAVVIQSSVRMYLHQTNYRRLRHAANLIQSLWKAKCQGQKARNNFLLLRQAAIVIQKHYRCMKSRQELKELKAAVKIQSCFKGYLQRIKFLKKSEAAVKIQRHWRAVLLGRNQRQEYKQIKQRVVKLQAACRGYLVRRDIKRQNSAALTIQSIYRGYSARKQVTVAKTAVCTIQRWIRSVLLTKKIRQQYISTRKTVITIQRFVRTRIQQKHENKAASLIQHHIRGFLVYRRYQRQRNAAIVIQKGYRGYTDRKHLRILKEEARITKAAVTIQSCIRGFMVRRSLIRSMKSAVTIQRVWRGYFQRKLFQQLKTAAILVQRLYKAQKIGRLQRKGFSHLKKCTLTIQRAVRQWLSWRQHNAATVIQSAFRYYKTRKSFLQQKHAAMLIQSCFRAYQQHKNFQCLKRAAIVIQARWRAKCQGRLARSDFLLKRQSCVKIQSLFKAHMQRKRYTNTLQTVTKIQYWWKAICVCKKQRQQYELMKQSVVKLQALTRGYLARKELKCKKTAVLIIQQVYRGYLVRKQLLCEQNAATTIQRWYRSVKLTREVRNEYVMTKQAVVKLQRLLRKVLLKKLQQRAAILIQSQVRKLLVRSRIKRQHKAVLVIQTCFRGYKAKKRLQELKEEEQMIKTTRAAVLIQSRVRGYLSRKAYHHVRNCAITIQRVWRGYLQRKQHQRLKHAAVLVQRKYRAIRLGRLQRKGFCHLKKCTLTIQRAIRCWLSWRRHQAATIIQNAYRTHRARKAYICKKTSASVIQSYYHSYRQRKYYKQLKSAAVVVQTLWRAKCEGQRARQHFLLLQQSVIVLQKHYRGMKAREEVKRQKAAFQIQAFFKVYLQRKKYFRKLHSAKTIQQWWRAYVMAKKERKDYIHTRRCLVLMQAVCRGFMVRREVKRKMCAAVRIQSFYRGYIVRKQQMTFNNAAVIIQNWFKLVMMTTKTRRDFIYFKNTVVRLQRIVRMKQLQRKQYRAAIIIQRHFRGIFARVHLQRQQIAVVKIQSCYRGYCARKQLWSLKEQTLLCEAAVRIQSCVRGYLARRKLEDAQNSALRIQRIWRGYQQRKQFCKLKTAVLFVQRKYITKRQCRVERKVFCHTRKCTVTIQRAVRRWLSWKQHKAATLIQSAYRSYIVRKSLHQQRNAVTVIQSYYRSYMQRKNYKQLKQVVIVLQGRWRAKCQGHIMRNRFLLVRKSVMVLQRHFRQVQSGIRLKVLQKREAHAALKIQSVIRMYSYRKHFLQLRQAVLKIQSLWRGRCVRRLSTDKRVKCARTRIAAATSKAKQENTLANRTSSALDFLLRCKDLAAVLAALINLDTVTRLLPECCERLVEANAVHVLYTMIRSSNRSVPHQELIKYSVSTLLNLAKYDKTAQAVYIGPDSVNLLVEQLTIYRDKKGILFPQICTLLGIVGHIPDVKKEILMIPRLQEKLRSLHALVARKHKMEQGRQKLAARLEAMKSFNCTLPLHAPAASKKRARVKPEWVLKRGAMSHIVDPMEAIDFVLETLEITPK